MSWQIEYVDLRTQAKHCLCEGATRRADQGRAAGTGATYHSCRAHAYTREKRWDLAESEFREAVEYLDQVPELADVVIVELSNLGGCLRMQ